MLSQYIQLLKYHRHCLNQVSHSACTMRMKSTSTLLLEGRMLEVATGLYLIDRSEEPGLLCHNETNQSTVSAVVNLSPTTPDSHPSISYIRVPDCRRNIEDGGHKIVGSYIEAGKFVTYHLKAGRGVAVHCNAGFQRSIPFLAWYLTEKHECTLEQAVARMTQQSGYIACVRQVLGLAGVSASEQRHG